MPSSVQCSSVESSPYNKYLKMLKDPRRDAETFTPPLVGRRPTGVQRDAVLLPEDSKAPPVSAELHVN